MSDDEQKDGKPTVALTFAQLVGLAIFILGLIGGFAALLYESIDKRLDKMEEKLEDGLKEHDGRLDNLTEKVSVQEVRLQHLEMMRATEKEKAPLIAAAGDGDGDDDEGSVEVPPRSRLRTRGTGLGRGGGVVEDVPEVGEKPVAAHVGEDAEGAMPPDDEDFPPELYEGVYPQSNHIEVADVGMSRREARKAARCRDRWRRGCPIDRHPFEGSLRDASGELAQMQLREASHRLAQLQKQEAR